MEVDCLIGINLILNTLFQRLLASSFFPHCHHSAFLLTLNTKAAVVLFPIVMGVHCMLIFFLWLRLFEEGMKDRKIRSLL